MEKKRKAFCVLAAVFGILAIVFYFSSIRKLDKNIADLWGIDAVANIQDTVFAAACAILCGINVAGAMILSSLESANVDKKTFISGSIEEQKVNDEGTQDIEQEVFVVPELEIKHEDGKCDICGTDINPDESLTREYSGEQRSVCKDCAALIDITVDEWTSGKKKEKAIAEIKDKIYSRSNT